MRLEYLTSFIDFSCRDAGPFMIVCVKHLMMDNIVALVIIVAYHQPSAPKKAGHIKISSNRIQYIIAHGSKPYNIYSLLVALFRLTSMQQQSLYCLGGPMSKFVH